MKVSHTREWVLLKALLTTWSACFNSSTVLTETNSIVWTHSKLISITGLILPWPFKCGWRPRNCHSTHCLISSQVPSVKDIADVLSWQGEGSFPLESEGISSLWRETESCGRIGKPWEERERDCIVKEESEVWCVCVCVCGVGAWGEVIEIKLHCILNSV